MLLEETGRDILVHCGVNVVRLKHQLERFFTDHMETLPQETNAEVVQTLGVQRVLQRAIMILVGKKDGLDGLREIL